ncbi:TRAP transporter substrate-binding protein [Acidimangrovimonas sediminis]|uniref:TRAP transporter substrate-binding protein n=1 Tax=Acidimangrovimonas sediminis TaxID=2056283 RepID=UPI000C8106F0|nr:TRAP transporter substrate-binding protein [Acidimangrovimonas sediminis]
MFDRVLKAAAAAALLLAPLIAPGVAAAREMRVSSFEPPQGFYSAKILQVWIDKVNAKLSKGNAFKLYPGSILGAPPAQADLVKAGVADVALVVPTYTPGVFPMTGVVEVPGLVKSSAQGTAVLNALQADGALKKEYADYKVIALFTTPGYRFLMTRPGLDTPAAMKGLKLRSPSSFGSTLLGLVGASGVSIPAPQVYENLERGVVSGAVWVMDAYRTFRLYEVAPYVVDTRVTASPMAILMNRNTYNALPGADRKVIDEMSGKAAATWISDVVDTTDAAIAKTFHENPKIHFVTLSDAQQTAWDTALKGASAAWVAAQTDKAGARKVLKEAEQVSAANAPK